MWKNRTGYVVMIAAAVGLFVGSGQLFMVYIAAGLAVLAVLLGVLIRRDASRIEIGLAVPGHATEGKNITFVLKVSVTGKIWVTQKLLINLKMKNQMFGNTDRKQITLLFSSKQKEYHMEIPMKCCGQIDFETESIQVQDLFRLFCVNIQNAAKADCICYPRQMNLLVEQSKRITGTPENEGIMQNRKGNDPSEMFDIREYVPGDDIRSIHWKLSSKTDALILREPSNPSHYRVAVLADYGLEQWERDDREEKEQEWNTIIAAGTAICRGLIEKGEKFCMIFPGTDGLQIFEIENRQDYVRTLAQWMRMPMRREQGTGYRYFIKQGLEHEFTRLVILTTGKYEESIEDINDRIGTMIVSADAEITAVRSSHITGNCEMIEIPVTDSDGKYRIIC